MLSLDQWTVYKIDMSIYHYVFEGRKIDNIDKIGSKSIKGH